MKNKKAIIFLSSIVVICAVGFIVSPLVNWPVDRESASGDIGKSSRFSRKTATESISNIEELIQNDAEYKDGIVASFVVMHTRVQQFGVLVNMSNEAEAAMEADLSQERKEEILASIRKQVEDEHAYLDNHLALSKLSRPPIHRQMWTKWPWFQASTAVSLTTTHASALP